MFEALEVELTAINRVILEPPVTGVNDDADWGTNDDCSCIGDRVVNADKFDAKTITQLHTLVRFGVKNVVLRLIATGGFFHLALEHAGSKFAGVNWCRNAVCKVTKRPNVVKVTVGKHQAANFVLALF